MREQSALEVLLVFLKLSVTSFGGPIAHIGYLREEIVASQHGHSLVTMWRTYAAWMDGALERRWRHSICHSVPDPRDSSA
jgi:chromate transport protein ChrA